MTKLKVAYSIVFGVLLILLVGFMFLPPIQEETSPAVAATESILTTFDSTETLPKPITTVDIQTPDNPHLQSVINSYHDFMQQAITHGIALVPQSLLCMILR